MGQLFAFACYNKSTFGGVMKRIIYLMCCILGVIGIATSAANAQQVNLSSPEMTVNSFVTSINQYNFKQAALCVDGAKPGAAAELSDLEQKLKKVHATLIISELHYELKDLDATVSSTVTVKVGESQEIDSVGESHLKLRKQKEEWKILSGDSDKVISSGTGTDFLQ